MLRWFLDVVILRGLLGWRIPRYETPLLGLPAETLDEYISGRVKDAYKYLDGKSARCRTEYVVLRSVAVVGAALVPVLVNIKVEAVPPALQWLGIGTQASTTIVSLAVAIAVSLEGVMHFGERYRDARLACCFIEREVMTFRASAESYKDSSSGERFVTLVTRVENIIQNEAASTVSTMTVTGGPATSSRDSELAAKV